MTTAVTKPALSVSTIGRPSNDRLREMSRAVATAGTRRAMSGALAGMSPFRDMGRAMFSPLCTRAAAVMTDGLRRRFCTAAATTSQAGLLSTAMARVSGDRC